MPRYNPSIAHAKLRQTSLSAPRAPHQPSSPASARRSPLHSPLASARSKGDLIAYSKPALIKRYSEGEDVFAPEVPESDKPSEGNSGTGDSAVFSSPRLFLRKCDVDSPRDGPFLSPLEDNSRQEDSPMRRKNALTYLHRQSAKLAQMAGHFTEDDGDAENGVEAEADIFQSDAYTGRARRIIGWRELIFGPPPEPLSDKEAAALRSRAERNFGVPIVIDDEHPLPTFVVWLDRFHLLNLALAVEIKKIRVAEEPPAAPGLFSVVTSLRFEIAVGLVLVASLACAGIDTYFTEEDRPTALRLVENISVSLFVIELLMRIRAHTWVWLFSPYNLIDVLLILITGVITVWFLEPLGVDAGPLKRFAAFRIVRSVRLCKAVRVMPRFRNLWLIVQGIIACGSLLFWALVLIFMIHFMFGVAVVEIVGKSDTFQGDQEVQKYFGDLPSATLTLFQTMTKDSFGDKIRPIIYQMPLSAVVFFLFIGTATILMNNLMTAIVIKQSTDSKAKDHEAVFLLSQWEYQKSFNELKRLFHDMDTDNSGSITADEFLTVLDDVAFIRKMKTLDIDLDEMAELFDILDPGTGVVTLEEFCTGLMRIQGKPSGRMLLKAKRDLSSALSVNQAMEDSVGILLGNSLSDVGSSLGQTHLNLVKMQLLTADILASIDRVGVREIVRKSSVELPTEAKFPTWEEIQVRERAKRKAHAKRMRAGAQEDALSLAKENGFKKDMPPGSWLLEYFQESRQSTKRVSDAPERVEEQDEEVFEDVQSEQMTGFVAEAKDVLKKLGVDPTRWQPSILRETANVPKEALVKCPTTPAGIPNDLFQPQADFRTPEELRVAIAAKRLRSKLLLPGEPECPSAIVDKLLDALHP